MSKLIPGNSKHLTLKDRTTIEVELNKGSNLSSIAKILCKDPSTIGRDVYKNRINLPNNTYNRSLNHCIHKYDCNYKKLCNKCTRFEFSKKLCRSCSKCNLVCKDFVQEYCPTCKFAPYVCNSCKKVKGCHFPKYYYKASYADKLYREKLINSRVGFNISEKEMYALDELVTPLIKQGQSPYQIVASNKNYISITPRTLYRYIDANALSAKNIDLSMKVRYKQRKTKKIIKNDKNIYVNRTYEDFIEFTAQNPDFNVVEMDTVIGTSESSKVLLTLYFRNCKFMMAFLLKNKTCKSVINIFDMLENTLGEYAFKNTFPIILTDRGTEFARPDEIEFSKDLNYKTNIYFCNPQAPYQKGMIERNHEYIRKILPKGTSFDFLTQEKVELMLSHINSTKRASLNGKTPFELATQLLPKEAMQAFNINFIESNKIILKPTLLK